MVIDSSALICILFAEELDLWVAKVLEGSLTPLKMSPVNYTEVLAVVDERRKMAMSVVQALIGDMQIEICSLDAAQAEEAARARMRYPLNIGDCFAYALAKAEGYPLLTLDRDFRATDIDVILPPKPDKAKK